MINGGSIDEFSLTYSKGTFQFTTIEGDDSTFDIGGPRSADTGKVTPNGKLVNEIIRVPGMFEIPTVANDQSKSTPEYEQICDFAGSGEEGVFTFSCLNGSVYKGSGTVQGDLKLNPNKASFGIKVVSGPGFQLQ